MPHLIRKITALLPVEAIEPVLPFWDALGVRRTVEMGHGDRLGFVILSCGNLELMYQTHASMAEDVPVLADVAGSGGRSFLFIEVADIEAVERALAGHPVVLPRRKTFYGATEVGFREPGGHCVTFAQFDRSA